MLLLLLLLGLPRRWFLADAAASLEDAISESVFFVDIQPPPLEREGGLGRGLVGFARAKREDLDVDVDLEGEVEGEG